MKHLLIIICAALMSMTATAQKSYTTSADKPSGFAIFKGPVTLDDLRGEPGFSWMERGESGYKPDAASVSYLSKELPAYSVVVLMGTWCDDSQNLVPKLAKTLTAANFPMSQFKMYGVDREKKTNGDEGARYDVKRVPTIILYKDGKEAGRIVESVNKSIEADLAALIGGDSAR
jgi:thiol-disulfide isomerase/thioredoxin